MIKGVLIYDNESGEYVYHKYDNRDIAISPYQLSSLVHAVRCIKDVKNPSAQLDELRVEQFVIKSEGNNLVINDLLGFHERIYFHDNKHYSGVFSVDEGIPYDISQSVFDTLVEVIYSDKPMPKKMISDELKSKLDDLLSVFLQ